MTDHKTMDTKTGENDRLISDEKAIPQSAIAFAQQRQLKIIEQLPKLFWFVLVLIIFFLFSSDIKKLVDRAGKINGFGVALEFNKSSFDEIAKNKDVKKDLVYKETFKYLGLRQQEQLINRVNLLQPILQTRPYKILWDDNQPANNIYIVKILEQIGFKIETASTTDAGLELLKATITDTSLKRYDIIISDYTRYNNDRNGLLFAKEVNQIDYNIPILFFSSSYEEEMVRTSGYVYAATNRADYLINYILDIVERGGTPPAISRGK